MLDLEKLKNKPFIPKIISDNLKNIDEQKELLKLIYQDEKGKKNYSNSLFEWEKGTEYIGLYLNDGEDYEELLNNPITIHFKKINGKIDIPNEIQIYSNKYLSELLVKYKDNYQFYINEKEINDLSEYNKEKIIMKIRQYVTEIEFNKLIKCEKISLISKEEKEITKIIPIDTSKLLANSKYFMNIKTEENFQLIINEKRLDLINNINKFFESKDKKNILVNGPRRYWKINNFSIFDNIGKKL